MVNQLQQEPESVSSQDRADVTAALELEETREEFRRLRKDGRKWAYHLLFEKWPSGSSQAAIVVEDHHEMFLLDYKLSPVERVAQRWIDARNRELGLTAQEVARIITSSLMKAKVRR